MIYLNKVPYFGNFLLFLDWVRSVLVGLYNWRSSVKIFKSVLVLSVLLTMLVACGDDSSSSVSPEPAGDSSSSVNQSSSSITDKGKSSGGSSKSSSSVKPGDDSQKSSSSKKIIPVVLAGMETLHLLVVQKLYVTMVIWIRFILGYILYTENVKMVHG